MRRLWPSKSQSAGKEAVSSYNGAGDGNTSTRQSKSKIKTKTGDRNHWVFYRLFSCVWESDSLGLLHDT